ncbi:M24 family metallopeptidase [Natranaeroarchaeum aerophilus]|uniref:M24 family metallopeptidase n=1 Tax=Natranaeroarchaeum aerophilus TaxID=2917711 RepID=A0AAE3FTA9_9EURY|nr:M24 family metallopeptidase [Natranaeroarchaeum aerophilus]MCL9814655.1 M24 family metallopeptidase [Natranaeroarchaeum aerophilus]
MREDRLNAYLESNDVDSVWFARPNSFAWLTGGNNVVDRAGDIGVAAAGYDGEDLVVVTNDIEAERLRDEELAEEVDVVEFEWHATSLAEAVAAEADGPGAADFEVPGFSSVDARELRQPLTESDIDAYRSLGRETAAAIESVARELQPGDTEREAAAALRVALSARGIEAPVALVGGSERAQKYRHYTPQPVELGEYALLSVTAEKAGLHASCTRTVAFDPPEWLDERHDAATTVEATALAATQAAGQPAEEGTAGDVFAAIQDAYAAVGHEGEWREHHQGGAAGFAGREWIATPGHDAPVHTPMAYAWNPTVQGAKSEDTVLVTDDGFEVLTETGRWPTTEVDAHGYDVTVDRPTILDSNEE